MTATLREMQDAFQAFLLRRAAGIESHVVGTARVPVVTRLGIYDDAYRSRLIEALQANYPALARLLGDEDFAALGTAYVRVHDSVFRSIRYYGAELADFLSTHEEYSQAPVLAELARWEWAMTEVFDAADAEPLRAEALAQVQAQRWAALRFGFHPALRSLALYWNVPRIWAALTEETERPPAAVQAEPVPWMVWREHLRTYFRSLSAAESEALALAREGGTFGEICERLCRHFTAEETPARAAGFLRQWMESGWIVEAG